MSDTLQFDLHPDADQINAFAEGVLTERDRAQTLAHLADCAQCRQVLFLVQESQPQELAAPEPVSGWRGWFTPLTVLGTGAALLAGAALIVFTLRGPHAPAPSQTARVEAPTAPAVTQAPAVVPAAQPKAPAIMGAMAAAPAKVPAAVPPSSMAMKLTPPRLANAPPVLSMAKPMGASIANNDKNPSPVRLGNPELRALSPKPATPVNMGGGMHGMPSSNTGSSSASSIVMLGSGAPAGTALKSKDGAPVKIAGVAGGSGSGIGGPAKASPMAAAPSAPRSVTETVEVNAAAATIDTQSATSGAVLDQGRVENLPLDGRNAATFSALSQRKPLPSKLPAVMSASNGKLLLAADSAGALFLSTNGGKHWKAVKPQWQGKVAALTLSPTITDRIMGAEDETAAAATVTVPAKGTNQPSEFQLTTNAGVVWTSADGLNWQRR